jgi:hypothetical protein
MREYDSPDGQEKSERSWTNCMNDPKYVYSHSLVRMISLGVMRERFNAIFVDILITIILNLHISRLLAFWNWEHKQSSPV